MSGDIQTKEKQKSHHTFGQLPWISQMLDAVVKAAIAVTPVGNFVDPCLFLLTEIWRSAENIKYNRCRARRLAERTQFVVDALFNLYGKKHEGKTELSKQVTGQVHNLLNLLEEISTYLNKLASQSTIKRLINNHSIEVNLDALSTSLLAQAQTLQLCLQFNQLEWRVEDREDQREDNIQIQNSLSLLLDNSHKILESLEIKHNQIMEAMEGIQKAIVFSVNLNSNAEKTMLEKVLNGLARVSNGIPILQPWTITSWEIEIDEAIAVGGYAEVCTGNWLGHTKVAVKRLLYRLDTEKAAKEFRQEVEIWHRLKHPHVLQLFGACSTADQPFMVCPYMSNGHLLQYLEKQPTEGIRLLYETSQGMQYLHASNVIHGDLKAINILVDDSGRAKITDFGFAVVKVTSNGNGNQSNIGTGTLRWTAPECLKGEKPTFKSDVYAFAVTCYEVVSEGCVPFSHLNDSAFRELILSGVRPAMPTGCPDGLSQLVGLCWDDDFAQRPLFNSISTSLKLILKTRSTNPSMGSSAVLTVQTAEKLPERSSERLLSNVLPPDSPTRGMAMSPPTSPISPTFSATPRTKSSRTRVATYPSIPQRSSSITSPTRAFPPQSPIQSHMRSSSITAVNNYVGNASGNSGDSGYTSGSNENFNRNQPNVPRERANSFTALNNDSFQRTPASRKQSFPLLSPSTSPSSVIPSFTSLSGWNLRPITTLTNDPSYEMLKRQADRGDANAMNKLGEMLLSIQQYGDAVNWFFKAAGMKCTQAMLHLGECYYFGFGVNKKESEAVKWFKAGAKLRDPAALCYLGHCYYAGIGVSVDYKQSYKYTMLSADQNFPVAQYNLAQQFLRGEGIKSDSFRAFGLFSKSATTFDLSMYYLGSLYYLGYGVCQNNKKALEWWVRAAEEKNCLAAKKTLLWYYSNDAKNKAEALKWKDRVESHVRRSGEDIRFGVNITTGIESNGMLKNQVR